MLKTQFCLKWNDYHESIVATLGDLRDEEEFVDVTLVCGHEHIKAHRIVLSACSDFFRQLFRSVLAIVEEIQPKLILYRLDLRLTNISNQFDKV